MRTTKYDVLITISYIIRKYKGNWCYASRVKLLELLEEFHYIKIGYRQLGNHLADLRDSGLIKSIRRTHRNDNGTLCLLTSARCLTITGCKYLLKRGVLWARNHLARLKAKYIPPEPGKPVQEKPPSPQELTPTDTGKSPFLDPAFRRERGLPPKPPLDPETA